MRINLNRAVFNRIKRANTDWWINEKAIVAANGKTYIAYFNDMGEIHINESNSKSSKAESRDFCLCRLNCTYADEHNSPSLCITEDGYIIVAYTGHASTGTLHYRITQRPYDIFSFGKTKTLSYAGHVTYAQIFENTTRGEIWLFTRVNGIHWEWRVSSDGGESFSEPRRILTSNSSRLYYTNIRRQLVPKDGQAIERFFFAAYDHPLNSGDHIVRGALIDANGYLTNLEGARLGPNLFSNDYLFDIPSLPVVYSPAPGRTVRLLSVSITEPFRVGLCTFSPDCTDGEYIVASYHEGAWTMSEPFAKDVGFLGRQIMRDGSQSYVGGFEFYYGVGTAGLKPSMPAPVQTDGVYAARKRQDGRYVLELYSSQDAGKTYRLEQEISVAPEGQKIWRPIVPVYAQDNMPVYWHEGYYEAHTGGWHCDVIMPVEYDN